MTDAAQLIQRIYGPNEDIPTHIIRNGYRYELQKASLWVWRQGTVLTVFIRST